jgi:hypothetical protein
MEKKPKKERIDIFTFVAECINQMYKLCHENGVFLRFLKVEPASSCGADSLEKYALEQNVWERAEAFEIMECLNPDSIFYKGDKITKNEIIDLMIDWGLEEQKNKKRRKPKCTRLQKK